MNKKIFRSQTHRKQLRTPTSEKKISDPIFFFLLFFSAAFVGNSVTPMSTLANNKRACSKEWKIQAKITLFLFFRR